MPDRATESHRETSPLRSALWSGSCASIASLISLCLLGRKATGHWTPAPNAISHWLWGRPALHKTGLTLRHTVAGIFIHHAASIFWALFFCIMCKRNGTGVWYNAIATSVFACFVDYKLTPQRLTPGFEHHLTKSNLAIVYGCFAAGLALSRSRQASTILAGISQTLRTKGASPL